MQNFPHFYSVSTAGAPQGDLELSTPRVNALRSAAPKEFDGPGDRWSPETLLVASVGDCFVLTFRGIAKNSRLPWTSVDCDVTGTLDRVDNITQFIAFEIHVYLHLPAGTPIDLAERVLDKAERNCLVANSLKGAVHLVSHITVGQSDGATLAHA